MTFLRRLLCLHEWTVAASLHPIPPDIPQSIVLRCTRCGKTSIHRIR